MCQQVVGRGFVCLGCQTKGFACLGVANCLGTRGFGCWGEGAKLPEQEVPVL